MALDMRGPHQHNPQPHYRRYLSPISDTIIAVCVQNFDYPHYHPHRFVDLRAFITQGEAETAAIAITDAVTAGAERAQAGDQAGADQAAQLAAAAVRYQPERTHFAFFADLIRDFAAGCAR